MPTKTKKNHLKNNQDNNESELSKLSFTETEMGIPVIPVRDIVIFPGTIVSLFIGRKISINAINKVIKGDRRLVFVTQKDSSKDDVNEGDLPNIAVLGTILQCVILPDETIKLLVDCSQRVEVLKYYFSDIITCDARVAVDEIINESMANIFLRSIVDLYEVYQSLNKKVTGDAIKNINAASDLSLATDVAASHLVINETKKLEISCILNLEERIKRVLEVLTYEIEILKAEKELQDRVRFQIDKNHKEYYLHEQMKVIKKELGDNDDSMEVIEKYRKLLEQKQVGMKAEVVLKVEEELKKLKNTPPMSSEAGIIKSYLDTILGLPWQEFGEKPVPIMQAMDILSSTHYGMEKAKERIIEYIAVQKNTRKQSGVVLCLYGPPGVGKTTLVRSIAKAMGREYAKVSLGGLDDAGELVGHRRTYIGALPGRIIQAMKNAKVSDPVILLDEIDKMSSNYRGDPASALLEILDPEQNTSFNDHYLEVGYDISKVVFVATANSLKFQQPLKDRMELIHIPSYLEQEKAAIAKQYIIPKQMEHCGLKPANISITDDAVMYIINKYTREAGVRELERCVSKILRKVVVKMLERSENSVQNAQDKPAEFALNEDSVKKIKKRNRYNTDNFVVTIDESMVHDYLGVEKFTHSKVEASGMIGVVNGLAYTDAGGDVLMIEGTKFKGKGGLKFTGRLGDVMKESMEAAYSYIKANAEKFSITEDLSKIDIHIHAPEGAVPKDGPSAGIAICINIISLLTGKKIRNDVAMTGEITLRGRVLAIGGLREKLTAAVRSGIKDVIIPFENKKDLEEVPKDILSKLTIYPCETFQEVLKIVFQTKEKLDSVNKKSRVSNGSMKNKVQSKVIRKQIKKSRDIKEDGNVIPEKRKNEEDSTLF